MSVELGSFEEKSEGTLRRQYLQIWDETPIWRKSLGFLISHLKHKFLEQDFRAVTTDSKIKICSFWKTLLSKHIKKTLLCFLQTQNANLLEAHLISNSPKRIFF